MRVWRRGNPYVVGIAVMAKQYGGSLKIKNRTAT
jgi:hypothetical protein